MEKMIYKAIIRYLKMHYPDELYKIVKRMGGKKKYTGSDIEGMKKTAALRAGDRNPYSWNMDYLPYDDDSGYEARFYTCGICALMKEYGCGTIATELISRGNIEVERTVLDAALSCYKYDVKDGIREYKNRVAYWRGENEPYPVKSARLLKKYLPQMKVCVFKGMGHGQLLNEHTGTYAKRLISFLEET